MLVKHYLRLTAVCPVNRQLDHYDLVVECRRVVEVEKILKEVTFFADVAMYQEQITKALSKRLKCKVTTTGYHSGVKTVCEC